MKRFLSLVMKQLLVTRKIIGDKKNETSSQTNVNNIINIINEYIDNKHASTNDIPEAFLEIILQVFLKLLREFPRRNP